MNVSQQFPFLDQKEFLIHFANSVSDLVVIANRRREIIFANRAACEKTGYKPKEIVGKRVPILYRKENEAKYTAKMYKALHETGQWSGEMEVQKKDGSTFWTDATLYMYYDKSGKPAGTLVIARDRTLQRLLEQRFWESENQLRSIIESMEDAVCVCDKEGTVVMCNDAHCRMLGYSKDEIVGVKPPYPWMDSVDLRKLQQGFKILRKEGKLKNYTLTWRRRDNSAISVSLAASLLNKSRNSISQFVLTVRDVTGVQLVNDLQRAQKRFERLQLDVKRKAVQLNTLKEINWFVLNHSNVSTIFKAITTGIKKLVEHDLAGVYVYDSEQQAFLPHTLSKQTPFSRKLAQFPLPLGEGIIGTAAVSGELILANNAQLDPRSRYPEGMRPEKEHFIAVPLKGRESIFGVLVVSRNRDPEFIEEEALIVKSFADAVMVALENARLLLELRKYQREVTKRPYRPSSNQRNRRYTVHQSYKDFFESFYSAKHGRFINS
ncbi:MAG: PAS domain S-box protein [Ignavibacteriae bacterium]|nr:PAS domain S-box protein [Ignavibacteriota bacterium]